MVTSLWQAKSSSEVDQQPQEEEEEVFTAVHRVRLQIRWRQHRCWWPPNHRLAERALGCGSGERFLHRWGWNRDSRPLFWIRWQTFCSKLGGQGGARTVLAGPGPRKNCCAQGDFAGLEAVWVYMLRMFARLIWPTLFCLLRRQLWRTDWSTACNTAASAPFSAQQRTCIASGLTAARGTKRRDTVHISPLRALNEQVSWFLLLSCSLHVLSSVLALFCVVRAEQRRGTRAEYYVTVTVAWVNSLNGGV